MLLWWLGQWMTVCFHVYITIHQLVVYVPAAYLSRSRVEVSPNTDVGSFQLCGTISFIHNAGDDLIECEPHRQGRYMRITRLDTGVHTGELRLCHAYVRAFLIRGKWWVNWESVRKRGFIWKGKMTHQTIWWDIWSYVLTGHQQMETVSAICKDVLVRAQLDEVVFMFENNIHQQDKAVVEVLIVANTLTNFEMPSGICSDLNHRD